MELYVCSLALQKPEESSEVEVVSHIFLAYAKRQPPNYSDRHSLTEAQGEIRVANESTVIC